MCQSVAVDVAGNVYTTGFFEGTVDFDPGPGTINLTSSGNYDLFVCKWTGAGVFDWAKNIGGTNHERGYSIFVDGLGNVCTTGRYTTTCDFDPGPGVANLTGVGGTDAFVLKLAQCIVPPVQPGNISGPLQACLNEINIYSVPPVNGALSYTWTLPNGWTGSSTSNTIQATTGANGGSVMVTAINDCGPSPSQTLPVTVNPTYTFNSAISICQGDSILLGGLYQQTTGNYPVIHTTIYGCDSTENIALTVNPLPPVPSISTNGNTFTSSSATGNQWYLNGNAVNGATNQTFTCTGNGNYTVCVTDANGCKRCSTVLNFTTFGIISNASNQSVSVYPNPTWGAIAITLGSISREIEVMILELNGQVVRKESGFNSNPISLDITELAAGMYFVSVKTDTGVSMTRLVKN
jgi:hypothetical protein